MFRQKSFANPQGACLYLVPTPIGNMEEITQRAIHVLNEVDVIACEDTRNSGILLKNLGIKKPLISHHEHNAQTSVPKIMDLLMEGKKVAVISDAGYPLISDPGAFLTKEVIRQDIPVISLSGANAALNALVASGLNPAHYLFYGFLDSKSRKRKEQLEDLKSFPYTMIFYEAPHRIESCLQDMRSVLGDRQICLARELTKIYEEYLRGTISEVLEVCPSLKGEMVLIVEGAPKNETGVSLEEALEQVLVKIEEGQKAKSAIREVADILKVSKNDLYAFYLQNKENES